MGIGNYFMNTNVDLFHDSTNNSNGILTSESNEMDLNTLIPVVDNNNHKVVDARLLHAFLQIRRDFTSWIKDRISKYGFIENQDFVLIKYDYLGNLLNDRLPHFGESDTQVVAKTDYLLLMDMAKELCMVENNDKGKKARRYFIEKEKELKKLEKSNNDQVSHLRISDFSNPAEAARAWADEYEAKVKAEKEAMLALEAKNKVEEEKKIVQAELNTAIVSAYVLHAPGYQHQLFPCQCYFIKLFVVHILLFYLSSRIFSPLSTALWHYHKPLLILLYYIYV